MTEEAGRYQAEFTAKAQGVAIGEGNTIYNYFYYTHEVKPAETTVEDGIELPCPYRGLFHFGPKDAEFFFGRDLFVDELYNVVQTRRFIPVLGASGSGKSSVVLAGLVPRLQRAEHWQFTHFRPGVDPFHGLALALVPLYAAHLNETEKIAQARQLANYLRQGDIHLADVFTQIQHNFPGDRVLLIADQFEELYTLCTDEAIRRNFLDKLIAEFQDGLSNVAGTATRSSLLLLTMRADFLGNALSYRPFADVLQKADLKLGPMNPEELTDVITKPAEKLGVMFESGLVERILKDVEAEPGNLPLLEFALTELWQRRQGKQLTHVAYTAIGEVQGALARHADASYARLSPEAKKQMRRIFVQLVRPGEGTEDTRRLATKAELGDVRWALVKQLADDRLVVTSRSETNQMETVEVVHEALLRNWGELREWMMTDRVFRTWQERLRGAMAQWQATQGDEGSLLRGAALVEAEEKLKEYREDLSSSEQTFIQKSVELRNRLLREEKIRQVWKIAGVALIPLAIATTWFFWNLLSKPKSPFLMVQLERVSEIADVKPQDEYFEALRSLVEDYKISPPLYSDGSFRSYEHISREQMIVYFISLWNQLIEIRDATAQANQCRLPDVQQKYNFNPPEDVTPHRAWYYDSYKSLAEASGMGNQDSPFFPLNDGLFHSDLSLTKAEMAAAVNRLLDAYLENYLRSENMTSQREVSTYSSPYRPVVYDDALMAQVTSISQFSDVSPSDWFYQDLQSLVERYGTLVGLPDGTFRPNQLATRGDLVVLLNTSMGAVSSLIDLVSSDQCQSNE